jgi:hypothetical protein
MSDMNYEEFKKAIEENLQSYLPEKYQEMEIRIQKINKINIIKDGLLIIDKNNSSGPNISPTLYLDDLYDVYLHGSLEDALSKAAGFIREGMDKARPVMDTINDNDKNIKDNIVFQVVNTEANKEMLEYMPHRGYLDLSVIYKWVLSSDKNNFTSGFITNDFAKNLGLTEEELFGLAKENTKRIMPSKTDTIYNIIQQIIGIEETDVLTAPKEDMYVITNEQGINGATSILYEETMHDLSQKLDCDLYILPSSIHEVIVVPASSDSPIPNELAGMVSEVNFSEVDVSERLSNQVYLYDKDLRKLSLATDTPDKEINKEKDMHRNQIIRGGMSR